MNALGVGYSAFASSWLLTDQADAGKVFSGASKFMSFLEKLWYPWGGKREVSTRLP